MSPPEPGTRRPEGGVITAPWGVWGARAPQYYYTIDYPYITLIITSIITLNYSSLGGGR